MDNEINEFVQSMVETAMKHSLHDLHPKSIGTCDTNDHEITKLAKSLVDEAICNSLYYLKHQNMSFETDGSVETLSIVQSDWMDIKSHFVKHSADDGDSEELIDILASKVVDETLRTVVKSLEITDCSTISIRSISSHQTEFDGTPTLCESINHATGVCDKEDEDIDINAVCDIIVAAALGNALKSLQNECAKYEAYDNHISSQVNMVKSKRKKKRKPGNVEFGLGETFLIDVFVRQARHDEKAILTARRIRNNKCTKKSRKERKLLKNMKKVLPDDTPRFPTYEEMGFWTEADLETRLDSSLTCPICMEVFLNPYSCVPCEHVFCEPCLRRLSKYNTDHRLHHSCPVCRAEIVHCVPNEVIVVQLKTSHAYEYNRRRRAERQNKYLSYPLPSKSAYVNEQQIYLAAVNRQRQQVPRILHKLFSIPVLRTCLCIVSLLITATLVSLCMRWSDSQHWSSEWWLDFCDLLFRYSDLNPVVQVAVTNQAVLLFGAIGLLSVVVHMCLNSVYR